MARITTNSFSPKTPRKLFVGAFCDLERQLARELTQRRSPLHPLLVVCPTRLLALHLQRTMGRALPRGHINIRFVALADFANQSTAPAFGLELLCRRIARELLSTGYFAPVHDTAGFAPALLATFTDLDEASVTSFPGKTPKLRLLGAAYAEFRSWLKEHHFSTEADVFRSAVSRPPSLVFLYGFYDLNTAQRQFVQSLSPDAIFFPSGNEFAQPLLDWFQSLGYTPVAVSPSQPSPTISFLSCPGEPAEVREAFRVALDWLRQHPERTFNDIAILCRSRDPYDALFRDTLKHLGIPAFIRGGRPLIEHPDARLLLLLLETIRTDYARSTVMELACHLGPHSDWDALTVELGILGGRTQWQARLISPAPPSSLSEERSFRQKRQLGEFVQQLLAACDHVPQRGRWAEFVEPVLAAFRQLGGQHPSVIEAIQALMDLEPFQPVVTLDEFAATCQRALEQAHEPTLPFEGGGIFIGDVMGARGLSWPLVIVVGLVEKSFPRLVREDPLLLDDERRQISPQLPLKRRGHAEERMLFQLAMASARERLVLSYPRLEAVTARPRVPSFLLLEAAGVADFQSLEKHPNLRRVPLSAFPEVEPALDERELDLAALRVLREPDDYLAAISPMTLAGVRAERNRWRQKTLTAYDGLMESAAARQLLQAQFGLDRLVISATSLEDFFRCPFYYFQKHVLRLEPWEEPENVLVIDAADLGSLYHAILEDYYRDGGDLAAVIEKHLRDFEQQGVTGYPAIWEVKKEIVRQELAAFISREQRRLGTQWKPSEFEKEFDDLAVAPPVRLRGKIDRIDRSADGTRACVLDYKTGKVPDKLRDNTLAGGEALQLPLYLLAAQQLLPKTTVEEAAYCYFTLRGGYRHIRFTREALEARRNELEALLEKAAEMIREGCFAQWTGEACRSCDFRLICGNGILKLGKLKAEDERLAGFRTLKEGTT